MMKAAAATDADVMMTSFKMICFHRYYKMGRANNAIFVFDFSCLCFSYTYMIFSFFCFLFSSVFSAFFFVLLLS